jgi:hypothetical protein
MDLEELEAIRKGSKTYNPKTDCEQRQAIAWHQPRLTKLGRETMLGPVTRHKTGRFKYRMSQPEPPVRRFNITLLLRNHQANASGGL